MAASVWANVDSFLRLENAMRQGHSRVLVGFLHHHQSLAVLAGGTLSFARNNSCSASPTQLLLGTLLQLK